MNGSLLVTYGSDSKVAACDAGGLGLIPGSGRSPGEEHGYPLQYSSPENSKDRGAWRATVPVFEKSWTRLSDQHFHFLHSQAQGEKTVPTQATWMLWSGAQ